MDAQKYKHLGPIFLICVKFCKCAKIYYQICEPFFVIVLYFTKRRCSQIEPQLKLYYLGWIYITLVEVDTTSVSPDQETVFPLEQGLENFPWTNPNLKGVLTYLNKIINIWDAQYIFNREVARFRNKIKRNSIPGVECLSKCIFRPKFFISVSEMCV